MPIPNFTKNTVLKTILQGVDPSWRASTTQYVMLLTGDPGDSGSLAVEANFTGYVRVAVDKATTWTDGGSRFTNAIPVQFGACSGGSNDVTHFAVVDTPSGAVSLMVPGALESMLSVIPGVSPRFEVGALSVEVG